jgi:DNA-binding NtrC family response regulator
MDLKVLLVDDEVEIAELYIRYLQRNGFSDVAAVHSSQAALSHIEQNRPHLVFLDISLGEESNGTGMDVLEAVRQTQPQCRICMMSAYRDEFERSALQKGAYAFVAKPFRPDTLLAIMKRMQQEIV